jgi:hypothetical protein
MKTATTDPVCNMQTANAIKDYLRGIRRVNPKALESLTNLSDIEWQRMALDELTHRMTHLVRAMQDSELMLVSVGQVRIANLIKEVNEETP